jgi:hypothetical protein
MGFRGPQPETSNSSSLPIRPALAIAGRPSSFRGGWKGARCAALAATVCGGARRPHDRPHTRT